MVLTKEQYWKQVHEKRNDMDEYIIHSEFNGIKEKIDVEHICSDASTNRYLVSAESFRRGSRCKLCAKKLSSAKTRWDNNRFLSELKKRHPRHSEYEPLDKYINGRETIRIKHLTCGKIYPITPNNLLKGKDCSCLMSEKISKIKTKTQEKFENEIENTFNGTMKVLGKYIGGNIDVKMQHIPCSTIFEARPNNLLQGKGCPKCARIARIKAKLISEEEFKNRLLIHSGTAFMLLEEYKGYDVLHNFKHTLCGNIINTKPSSIIRHTIGCQICAGNKTKTTDEFKEEVYKLEGARYEVLGEYTGAQNKIKMKHTQCSFEYNVAPTHFLKGTRCPRCCQSKGEQGIIHYLEDNGVKFVPQYKLDGCVSPLNNPLPFDVAIFSENDELLALCEFNGAQHYMPIKFFGGIEGFKTRQEYDKIKIKHCEKSKIKLLIIKYTDIDNVSSITADFVNTLDLNK